MCRGSYKQCYKPYLHYLPLSGVKNAICHRGGSGGAGGVQCTVCWLLLEGSSEVIKALV